MSSPTNSREGEHDEYEYDCKTCRFFYGLDLPIASTLSVDELRNTARAHSISVFRSWVQLNSILKRYEEPIRKRWLKRNYAQRTAILTEAWPGIAVTHRPDFDGIR